MPEMERLHKCIVYEYKRTKQGNIRASVDSLSRDGAEITCLRKLGAPGDISLFKHLTKLYELYSSYA